MRNNASFVSDLPVVVVVVLVDRTRPRSRLSIEAHLAKHRNNPNHEVLSVPFLRFIRQSKDSGNVDESTALHRGPACDGMKVGAVGRGDLPCSFGDIERNRCRRATKLIAQVRVTFWHSGREPKSERQEFKRTAVDIKLLVIEHYVRGIDKDSVSVATASPQGDRAQWGGTGTWTRTCTTTTTRKSTIGIGSRCFRRIQSDCPRETRGGQNGL